MQNKKGFTLIELMIVVAIVAILAMIAVPMYQRYIERSRNTASQNLLQQIGLAEIASQTEGVESGSPAAYELVEASTDTAAVENLMAFGFRPDPNVGFTIHNAASTTGFVAFACHRAANSQMYVYDNIAGGGVKPVSGTDKYAGVSQPDELYVFIMKAGTSIAELDTAKTLTLPIDGGKSTGI